MAEDDIIPNGPDKGQKFELAPQKIVSLFAGIEEEFMKEMFDFDPGDYLITDESSLHDFTWGEDVEFSALQEKVKEHFDVDISPIESGNLAEIFLLIHKERYGAG